MRCTRDVQLFLRYSRNIDRVTYIVSSKKRCMYFTIVTAPVKKMLRIVPIF